MGKFVIQKDTIMEQATDKKQKYCIKLSGPSFKHSRLIATETDQQRLEWFEILSDIQRQAAEGKVVSSFLLL